MELPDILGHAGYIFLLTGVILLARKKPIGWLFRIVGDVFWITVGFLLSMSAIWFWCIFFLGLDIYGYFFWRRKQKSFDAQS